MALFCHGEQMTIPTLTRFSVLDVERKLRLAYEIIILLSCLTRWQYFKTCSPGPFRVQRLRLWAEYVEFLEFVYSTWKVIFCINLLPFSRQVFAIGQSSWGTQLKGTKDSKTLIYIQAEISSIKSTLQFRLCSLVLINPILNWRRRSPLSNISGKCSWQWNFESNLLLFSSTPFSKKLWILRNWKTISYFELERHFTGMAVHKAGQVALVFTLIKVSQTVLKRVNFLEQAI